MRADNTLLWWDLGVVRGTCGGGQLVPRSLGPVAHNQGRMGNDWVDTPPRHSQSHRTNCQVEIMLDIFQSQCHQPSPPPPPGFWFLTLAVNNPVNNAGSWTNTGQPPGPRLMRLQLSDPGNNTFSQTFLWIVSAKSHTEEREVSQLVPETASFYLTTFGHAGLVADHNKSARVCSKVYSILHFFHYAVFYSSDDWSLVRLFVSNSECPPLAPVSCIKRCWCLTVSVLHTNDSEDDTQVGDRRPQLTAPTQARSLEDSKGTGL